MRTDGITSGVIGLALDKKAFIDEPTAKDLCPSGAAKVSEILRFTQDAMVSRDVWFSLIVYHSADRV
jgi:hypothetical protein